MSSIDDEFVPPGRRPSRRAFIRTTARTAAGVLIGGALVRTFTTEPPTAAAAGIAPARSPVHALSHAGLSAQLGRRFLVSGGAGAVSLRLIRIDAVAPSVTRASHLGVPLGGEQFSLVFSGPRDRPLAEAIYDFRSHSGADPAFSLFISPTTDNRDGQRYIASVNRHAERTL